MNRVVRSLAVAAVGILLLGGAASSATAASAPSFHHHTAENRNPRSPLLVVDKQLPLSPRSYAPSDLVKPKVRIASTADLLRKVPAKHLEQMFAAYHRATGKYMAIQSAYRSYASQRVIYNRYVSQHGQAWADRSSARPGYSEHQTGLALDIAASPASCTLTECFAKSSQGRWLAANAWKYGYILRYPNGYEKVTGYKFEPWHYRYVGVPVATDMHDRHVKTLEQYFGYPSAPDYR